ncbi:hypothetical protein [Burkholderia gladioli]|uniref:hypothetical protein n=1 Tax=Burkholderia gladioli TaxID=28095 RepID=UPI00163F0A6D|nr:hypothetical protein [Burkholderia gladioli]
MSLPAALRVIPTSAVSDAACERASVRFLKFFVSAIRNRHTRRAYTRAVGDFLSWCGGIGVPSIAKLQPLHFAT